MATLYENLLVISIVVAAAMYIGYLGFRSLKAFKKLSKNHQSCGGCGCHTRSRKTDA